MAKKTVQERILRQLICMSAVLAEIRENIEKLAASQSTQGRSYGPSLNQPEFPKAIGFELPDLLPRKANGTYCSRNPRAKKGGA